MICIPIVAATMDEALADIALGNAEPCDLIELRLDCLGAAANPEALLAAAEKPCIATCRPTREGGNSTAPDADRLALLARAAAAGAAYLDIEADTLEANPKLVQERILGCRAQVIASHHNFAETPADIGSIIRRLESLPCHIVKFAFKVNQLYDNVRIWNAMRTCGAPVIGLGMGELGEVSRVLALRFGSLLTFGSLSKGKESAPGQLTARELAELYRVRNITEKTALYAVVGDPIAHSLSPEIHNSAFRKLGMDAAYLRFRVADLADFLKIFDCLKLRGISVTIPHKYAALLASSKVEEVAKKIGAVNTLIRQPGNTWRGDNTDWQASGAAIANAANRCKLNLKNSPALLLGAGGAAKGVAYALASLGCKITIANRTFAKAQALAEELGASAIELSDAAKANFAVVANTTSLGMHPKVEDTPVDAAVFKPGMVVFDAVYNPRRTRMLREASARGAEVADGVEMFVGQAARQFELWTGKKAPLEVMEKVVVDKLK